VHRTDVIIIGAGQAGLATSHWLARSGIEHLVLEGGRVAERWRSERWESLRLLTPNWLSRLPGWHYRGNQPGGYMSMPEIIDYLAGYAASLRAPIQTHTTVLSVDSAAGGYRVTTDRGSWRTRNVVVATGACGEPRIPAMARELSPAVVQTVPARYRRPDDLPAGAVLVVGGSASGVQLADELVASGRPVYLAVGRHTRLPRTYRGRDIMCWLDVIGVLSETTRDVRDLARARSQPSLQLAGRPDRANLDLPTLVARGVRVMGRAVAATRTGVAFADDLEVRAGDADRKLGRLRDRIEAFIDRAGLAGELPDPEPLARTNLPPAKVSIDLRATGVRSIIWATGSRPAYPWLNVPVLDERGCIRHEGGVTAAPGLFVLGLPLLRTRRSSYIDGVGDDARAIAADIAARLGVRPMAA
jgi:putative flavoprotein involved in K+ transport